ncbi:PAS domain-containing sensor histidine kinase [soil metagenome]
MRKTPYDEQAPGCGKGVAAARAAMISCHMPSDLASTVEQLQAEILRLRSAEAGREEELRNLFAFMPQLGWTAKPDGSRDFYNRRWYEYTGTTFEEMQGWGWRDVHDPRMLPSVVALWESSLRTGAPFEMESPLKGRDGTFRWFLMRVEPLHGADGRVLRWVGINTDIDDRKRAGDRSEENFRLLVESVKDYAFIMLDRDGRVVTWNHGAEVTHGYAAAEVMGESFSRFYSPEDVAAGKPARDLDVAAAAGRLEEEGWKLRKNGSKFFANVVLTAMRSPDGRLRGFAQVTRDVTAAKMLAIEGNTRKLIEEERDQLLALTTDLIGVAGFDGYFKRVNPSWMETLGWTSAEITGSPWLDFVHPEDLESTIAAGAKLIAGEPVAYFENRYRCKNGDYRWLDWRCVPLVEEGRIFAIARDVTLAKQAEETRSKLQRRLVVADRMVSVGTLAAGVAHEINNPLSYVMANLDLVVEEIRALSGGSSSGRMKELEEMALEAREGAERVRKIVRGLKTFSRADDERREVMDVRPALELAINMSFNEIRHRARLVKDYGETPLIEADEARLGQVFTNLLVNAAQAIPDGDAEGNEIRIVTSTDAQGRAVVEVRDTGPGIPEDVRTRIFEPFFTTKSVGAGTGLGLSICHNIVTGMDGEISVSSVDGRGTSFRVVLPAARVQQLPGTERISPTPAPRRRATVLVVDDEPAVGMAFNRILREHEVCVVTSVKDALDILASGKRFDVIFSDLMMPQKTGIDFYEELTRSSPQAAGRIVFVTGGAFTPAAAEFLEQVANERIEKPFTPNSIRELVQRFIK